MGSFAHCIFRGESEQTWDTDWKSQNSAHRFDLCPQQAVVGGLPQGQSNPCYNHRYVHVIVYFSLL